MYSNKKAPQASPLKTYSLSWILKKFKDGIIFVKNFKNLTKRENVITSAFHLKNKNYAQGYKSLMKQQNLVAADPDLINLILGLNFAIRLERKKEVKKYALELCKNGNSFGCEITRFITIFKEMSGFAQKEYSPKNLDYRDIIKSKPERLNEKIRISQRDIEIIDEQVLFKKIKN